MQVGQYINGLYINLIRLGGMAPSILTMLNGAVLIKRQYIEAVMMEKSDIETAKELKRGGKTQMLYEMIKPLLKIGDSHAMYFYSTMSLAAWNESEEEFDKRRVKYLKLSADAGVPEAMYQLACCYLYGEGVMRDAPKAKKYAGRAAACNLPEAKELVLNL